VRELERRLGKEELERLARTQGGKEIQASAAKAKNGKGVGAGAGGNAAPDAGGVAAAAKVDWGGRGIWQLDEALAVRLPEAERARLVLLESLQPTEAGLAELVQLRRKAVGGALPEIPGTPEHMLDRWGKYKKRGKSMSFEQWRDRYRSALSNSVRGVAREKVYRDAINEAAGDRMANNRVLPAKLPDGREVGRQIDVAVGPDAEHLIQIKSGKASYSKKPHLGGGRTAPALSTADAIAADAYLIRRRGKKVTWVFESGAEVSGDLMRELRRANIEVIIRAGDESEKATILKKLAREHVDPSTITMVQGTLDDLVKAVVNHALRR
jgi:hypothetical protein